MPERWGSLLVQEEYQEEMPVTRDIIIIIIIIIILELFQNHSDNT
jgi:hypothetical protein